MRDEVVRARLCDLRSDPDLRVARRRLCEWDPPDAEQAATRDRIVAWIDAHPHDAHLRTCPAGHLTASALVVDADRARGLLTHHKKLGRWLQLGGHCDGDANLAHVALREAVEESGIADLVVDPWPIDVDVHVIPARKGEPEHLHLDTRFVIVAPPGARIVLSEESHALRWVAPQDLNALATDESVGRLFNRVFGTPS
jgi:8-oxo-dGTP pyrophosphatase MutT (NUDIX family)